MDKHDLLGDDSDEGEPAQLTINQEYARKYTAWKEKERLQELKAKHGDDATETTSSSSEDEDDEPDDIDNKDFFKTLSCLMSRDPKIYDENVKFFKDIDEDEKPKEKRKKEKPVYLKDHERKMIMDNAGVAEDESDDEGNSKAVRRCESPTFVEQEKLLKQSFATDFDNEEEDWLTVRQKNKDELKKEDDDYMAWMKGQKKDLQGEGKKEMKYLRNYWKDPNLKDDDAFLRDYILQKKYLDDEDKFRIPSYDEIVHDDESSSEDERTLEKQEEFEHKYNFRFEEPDPEFIKRYPRTMKDSLRKTDDSRKKKREAVKQRKLEEKKRKGEELKQLKALKRKEITEKLAKINQISGNTAVGFDKDDIEEDFDPNEHDRKMQKIFNEDYYHLDEDEEKPEFSEDEDEDIIENWDNWVPDSAQNHGSEEANHYEPHCEDADFNMDADYDPRTSLQKEMKALSQKKRKRKSHFAEVIQKKKPLFDPNAKPFEEYLDEYYKLDYEDIIGDMPCRFKYRKVVGNDFGLSVDEILKADDKELNKWCSLKKTYQYRSKEKEKYDVQAYQQKSKNFEKKKKVLNSLYSEPDPSEADQPEISNEESVSDNKKKNKKVKKNDESLGQKNLQPKFQNDQAKFRNEKTADQFQNDQGKFRKEKTKTKVKQNGLLPESETVGSGTGRRAKKNRKKREKRLSLGNAALDVDAKNESNTGKKRKLPSKTAASKKFKHNDVNISADRLRAYGINPKKFKSKTQHKSKLENG